MAQRKRKKQGSGGWWALSYIIPIAVAWPIYALGGHSTAALVVGVVLGFAVFFLLMWLSTEGGIKRASPDAKEAKRRNAEEERRVQQAMSKYIAAFRSQGYNIEAARAMARKRFREESQPHRVWHASDIQKEREQAELQRKIDTGQLVFCPSCGQDAPVSQGVILAHNKRSGGTCQGEGTIVR